MEMQHALNDDAVQYLPPEEEARLETAKLEVKAHYLRFFRHHAVKKNVLFFNRWRSHAEYMKNIEEEYLTVRRFIVEKRSFLESLKAERMRLTRENDPLQAAQAASTSTKTKGEEEALTMVRAEPTRSLRKSKLFKGVFSVYK